MNERILFRLDAMSIAESNSTRVGSSVGGYGLAMNQFSNRSIAPSSDGSTPLTTTSTFLDAAEAQPITVATGRPGRQRNETRDYQPGRYLSPSQLPYAPNPQNTPDTMPSVPSYSHQQSPPFPGEGSSRSSSSRTVRPPVGSPRDSLSTNSSTRGSPSTNPNTRGSPSTNSNIPSPRPSPSVRSSSSGDSTGTHSSTRSVVGGQLALFNQMASQKKEKVEWKISSSGPSHKPTFDAQVFGMCRRRFDFAHAFTTTTSHSSRLLSREGSRLDQKAGPADRSSGSTPKSRLGVSFYLTGCCLQLISRSPDMLAVHPRVRFGLGPAPAPPSFGRVRTSGVSSINKAGYTHQNAKFSPSSGSYSYAGNNNNMTDMRG